jgi:transcriptional regulator with GAF, ATPase, and Fis domain
LQNVIERALIVCKKKTLRFDSLEAQAASIPVPVAPPEDGAREILTEKQMRARERDNILAALEQTGWKIYGEQGTAALLGIKPTTLSSRIKTFGLKKP